MKFDTKPTFAKFSKTELKYFLTILSLAVWITAAIAWLGLMLVPFMLSERFWDTQFDYLEILGSIHYVVVYLVITHYKKNFEKQITQERQTG